jgi:hypothetical protein
MGFEQRYDLDAIREFVMNELSNQNGLLPDAFPMTQRILTRQGVTCGVFYCLHGPRNIRLTAVFDFDADRVLLYDSRGQRTCSYALSEVVEEVVTTPHAC